MAGDTDQVTGDSKLGLYNGKNWLQGYDDQPNIADPEPYISRSTPLPLHTVFTFNFLSCGTIVLVFQRTFATIIDHEVSSLAISSYIPTMIVSLASREVLKLRFRLQVQNPQNLQRNRGFSFVEYYNNACADYSRHNFNNYISLGSDHPIRIQTMTTNDSKAWLHCGTGAYVQKTSTRIYLHEDNRPSRSIFQEVVQRAVPIAEAKSRAILKHLERIHSQFHKYLGRRYVDGHDDIFDMVDIDIFTMIALNKMVLQLGYTGFYEEANVGRTEGPVSKEADGTGQEAVESSSDEQVDNNVKGINTTYETQYHVESSEDAEVVNLDGFDCDTGNDNETSNYRSRRLDELRREIEGIMNASGRWMYSFYTRHKFSSAKEAKDKVYMHSIESKKMLKLYKNDNIKVRARCDGNVLVFTMSQEMVQAAEDVVQHESHFILEIIDNGFGSLETRACVNLRSRRVFNPKRFIKRDEVGDGSRRDEAFLHMLCVLDGFLDVSFKNVKLVKFLVYLVSSYGWLGLSTQPTPREGWGSNGELGGVEKVRALGANGVMRVSSRGFKVWFWICGLSLEDMSIKSVRGIFFGGFWVEELALDAMEYDDQDKWNEEVDLKFQWNRLAANGTGYTSLGSKISKILKYATSDLMQFLKLVSLMSYIF
ncbi:hypothetical protein Tco_1540752 [Tanacetum coccineum]